MWIINLFGDFMKKFFLLLSVSFLLIFGCGETKDKTAETIAEEAIESQTGEDAEVEIDDEGESFSLKTKEGDAEFSAGGKAEIPNDFPKDVYVYDGASVQLSMAAEGNFSLKLITDDNVDKIISKYEKEMESEGWEIEGRVDVADQKTRIFKKENRQVSLSASPENDKYFILINTAIINDN